MCEYCLEHYEQEEEYDEERELEREQEYMSRCWCGAFQYSAKNGKYMQYADCVCGAE